MRKIKITLLIITIIILLFAYTFGVCAFGLWLLDIIFKFGFTWKKAFIFWFVFAFILGGLKITINMKK